MMRKVLGLNYGYMMTDKKTLESRQEYWIERLREAENAVEVAKDQVYQCQVGLGNIAVQEMIEAGTLSRFTKTEL